MEKTITLSKTEYNKLKKQARAYKVLSSQFFASKIKDPIKDIVDDFKNTDIYTDEFLKDLEGGLRKSSYSKKS